MHVTPLNSEDGYSASAFVRSGAGAIRWTSAPPVRLRHAASSSHMMFVHLPGPPAPRWLPTDAVVYAPRLQLDHRFDRLDRLFCHATAVLSPSPRSRLVFASSVAPFAQSPARQLILTKSQSSQVPCMSNSATLAGPQPLWLGQRAQIAEAAPAITCFGRVRCWSPTRSTRSPTYAQEGSIVSAATLDSALPSCVTPALDYDQIAQ